MNTRPDMSLPQGFTCKDCYTFKRFCEPMGITEPAQTTCDYYPVRFHVSLECVQELIALAHAPKEVA